jgi:hypothetical protein
MSIVLDGTSGITFPSGSGTQAAQSKVLQVVQSTLGTQVNVTTTSFIDAGLSASITPLFSTSKILVLVSLNSSGNTGTLNSFIQAQIVRNSTVLSAFGLAGNSYAASGNTVVGTLGVEYLDSPATTSSTTYKIQVNNFYGNGTAFFNAYQGLSTITLMEIAV